MVKTWPLHVCTLHQSYLLLTVCGPANCVPAWKFGRLTVAGHKKTCIVSAMFTASGA
ncbi:hypothetical protein PF010_g32985 [Phytophthora fragariae]|uniref:Uncharacterized protein n=1 Tax=Phytophthora fragariae TaxID=53985 RepID=A0A6A4AI39_9STRA|nr:hypothetical protein PF009_g15844 [Phytophthora fragariae]KAE9053246.1 hypothetical protein PF010_g32985 [Phytophthora fragariae]KAE9258861.1 hypothetical protein PF001_g33219 [Phytophthora fragariae]